MSDRDEMEALILRARQGDSDAAARLLESQRSRLRKMVAVHLDPVLGRRVDPSDVVQDAIVTALRRLPEYLNHQPLPIYPWLRQIAWNRLVDLYRYHVKAPGRSIRRERSSVLRGQSSAILSERLCSVTSGVTSQLVRDELRQRIELAMQKLSPSHQEILILRQLEEMSVAEVAVILKISEGTVKSRHFRALNTLREIMEQSAQSEEETGHV